MPDNERRLKVSKNSLISRMNPIDDIIKYPDGHNITHKNIESCHKFSKEKLV